MAGPWEKYQPQAVAPAAPPPPTAGPWDKYRARPAASPVEGMTGAPVTMPNAGPTPSIMRLPSGVDPMVGTNVSMRVPPAEVIPPAEMASGEPVTTTEWSIGGPLIDWISGKGKSEFPEVPSAVAGLLAMENAADPELWKLDVGGGLEMTPERQARLDRIRQLGWASTLNQTDEGLLDSIKSIYPDAQLFHDVVPDPAAPDDPEKARHNAIVVVNGQPYYLNAPGLDQTDLSRYGPSTVAAVGVGMGVGGAVQGLVPRMLAAGAADGLLSAGLDVGAQWAGSKQPVDLTRAGLAAGFGAAAEGVGWLVGNLIRRYGRSAARTIIDPATGQPTVRWSPEALAALRQANVDPDTVSAEWLAQFRRDAQSTLLPEQAMRAADLDTLPTPVPYSRGDITRLPGDQMTEDLMFKGSYGSLGQAQFNMLRQQQQEALAANAQTLAGRLGGPGAITQPGIGAQVTSETLNRLKSGMEGTTNALYDAARAAPGGGLDIATSRGLAFDLASGGRVPDLIAFAPKAQAMLQQFDELISGAGNGTVTIRAMMDWRRRVTNLAGTAADATDRTALTGLRRTFDDKMKQMVEASLFHGDDASVQLWADAIGSRAQLGRLFEGDDLIAALTSTEYRSGAKALSVPPDQAANYIFGVRGLGAGNADLARDFSRMRDILIGPSVASDAARAEGTAAWNALREEAFGRLIRAADGPYNMSTAARSFSGANMAAAIDSAMKTNPTLMRTLFTAEELATIEQLKRAALAVTTTVRGGQNSSNSGPAIANLFSKFIGGPIKALTFGPNSLLTQLPLGLGRPLTEAVGATRAAGRVGPVVTQAAPFGGLLGGAGGSPLFYPAQGLLGPSPEEEQNQRGQ